MIGRLRGRLIHKQPPELVVDVQGVGYELEAPMSTFYELPAVGEEVQLFTHLQVREDAHTLYGFADLAERSLFRTLLKVSGVGAKMALAILSGMSADTFRRCISEGDTAALTRLPGVGKKTAERLVVEMRDRIKADAGLPAAGGGRVVPAQRPADPVEDAVHALIALGYKPQEASRMVSAVDTQDKDSETIIRDALKASLK